MNYKKCRKCGVEKNVSEFHERVGSRDGLRNECKACCAIQKNKYYQDNKEAIKARVKVYGQDNKEVIAARSKKYRQDNKEQIAASKRKYGQNNKVKIAEHRREYRQDHKAELSEFYKKRYQNNKEKIKTRIKKYMQTPPGKLIEAKHRHKRRAQKRGVLYEIFDPQEVFERDGWRCQHCHKKVQWLNKSPHSLLYPNLDHIVPLSKGGEHTRRNTQLLCRECNSKKYINDIDEQLRLF